MRGLDEFRKTLAQVAGLLAMPYGYTISIWTAGSLASFHFGRPDPLDIVAFAAGAVIAFLLVGGFALRDLSHSVPHPVSSAIVLNILPLIAVCLAPVGFLAAWAPLGFGSASFLVTLGYAIGATAFLEIMARRRGSSDAGRGDAAHW